MNSNKLFITHIHKKTKTVFLPITLLIILQCSCNHNSSVYEKEALLIQNHNPKKALINIVFAEIGHYLFFDNQLSINHSKSCASCHNPNLFFTDGYKKALGIYADVQDRNTPSIINSNYFKTLNWANPSIASFEQQMMTPLFSKQHFEMGMTISDTEQVEQIFAQKQYQLLPNTQLKKNQNWNFVIECISNYMQLLESRNSKYDNFINTNDSTILSANQLAGMKLFFSESLQCSSCHGGIDNNQPIQASHYFSNHHLFSNHFYETDSDKGLYNETKNKTDIGKFRIPSLRNVMHTAPYLHNGSLANMNLVLQQYTAYNNLHITELQKNQLIDFLETLTDSSIFQNSIFFQPNR